MRNVVRSADVPGANGFGPSPGSYMYIVSGPSRTSTLLSSASEDTLPKTSHIPSLPQSVAMTVPATPFGMSRSGCFAQRASMARPALRSTGQNPSLKFALPPSQRTESSGMRAALFPTSEEAGALNHAFPQLSAESLWAGNS